MSKIKTNAWLFWTVLIMGLLITGACSNSPTTPDPSDVQDFTLNDGDDLIQSQVSDLVAELDSLKALGGGVSYVDDGSGYTVIGCFDQHSGTELHDVTFEIHPAVGDPFHGLMNKFGAWKDLDFPITVTVAKPGYVAKTYVATSANVICIPMEMRADWDFPAMVAGYTFNSGGETYSWLCKASSTHPNRPWELSYGGAQSNPSTYVFCNSYQPVGAVAFVYRWIGPDGEPIVSSDLDGYELQGYSYAHIGSLDPGAVGAWILNYNEEGIGTEYNEGTFTITHTPPATPILPGTLKVTPGGYLDDSHEFVPYYPPIEIDELGDSTYAVTAFTPPVNADRDVVIAEFTYDDGCVEKRVLSWDPSGVASPDITFAQMPEISESKIIVDTSNPTSFDVTWDNNSTPGFMLVDVENEWGIKVWEIALVNTATTLPDSVYIPQITGISGEDVSLTSSPQVTVTRLDCAGVTPDAWDYQTLWTGTTAWNTSAPSTPVIETVVP